MRFYQLLLLILVLMFSSTGCNTFKGTFGRSSKQEAKQADKIETLVQKQTANQNYSLNQIASLSYGVGYSLDKLTNDVPKEIGIAKDLNGRILTLSGMPSLEDIKEMEKIVDTLRIDVVAGQKLLSKKDKEIEKLQDEKQTLEQQKNEAIKKYMQIAQSTAIQNDTNKAALDEYKSWFGLKAVFLGFKQFFTTSMWILIVIAIVFIVLRFASQVSPIASSVFGIFEQIVAGGVKTVEWLFPKAINFAGHVTKESYNQVSSLLKKLVDNIQSIKEIEKRTGHDITLKEVLIELDKSMDDKEKEFINKIKKELGY